LAIGTGLEPAARKRPQVYIMGRPIAREGIREPDMASSSSSQSEDAGPPTLPPKSALEMLARLQARTLQQCATLRRLSEYLAECGSDEQARRAAETVMRYFDTCPPQYFRDEEEDLYPALRESMAGSEAVCLNELTAGMTQQHRTLETKWARLRKSLAAVVGKQATTLDSAEVEAFASLNRSHIDREQAELLPMAERLLTDEALDQVWASMRLRHGI
jgi:hemerythrin HHE cation binding domain-containing protein